MAGFQRGRRGRILKPTFAASLDRPDDGFSLAGVRIPPEFLYAVLVCRSRDYQPWHRGKIDCGRQIALGIRQFPIHGEGNEHLATKQPQQFEAAYSGEIQDRRCIGDNDQRRSIWRRVRRSSQNSSTP
jgi:hypothetical protein